MKFPVTYAGWLERGYDPAAEVVEICSDLIDNEPDGRIDCLDPECAGVSVDTARINSATPAGTGRFRLSQANPANTTSEDARGASTRQPWLASTTYVISTKAPSPARIEAIAARASA